jgi:hypothetical protein
VLSLRASIDSSRTLAGSCFELSMKTKIILPLALCSLLAGTSPCSFDAQAQNAEVRTGRLSAGLDEIVKLIKAGVDESVILVFIQKSPVAYNPDADEIIQLRELGVSSSIITALLRHGEELRQRTAATEKQLAPAARPATVDPPAPTPAPTVQAVTSYPASYPNVVYTAPTYYAAPAYGYGAYGYPGYFYPRAYSCYPGAYYYGGYPRVSFGLSFGGGYYGGGGFYAGGYRGGYYRGGYGYCR